MADWNTHWWCPKTGTPAGGTLSWKTTPLQCKGTQRLISVLKQHSDEIGLSKCVLKVTTIDERLSAAVSLLPHDAAVSLSCAKFSGSIHSNMTPQNVRCSEMHLSRKNELAKSRGTSFWRTIFLKKKCENIFFWNKCLHASFKQLQNQ